MESHLQKENFVRKTTKPLKAGYRLIAAIAGVALLGYLIWRVGPLNIAHDMAAIGWGLALVIALGGVIHLVRTCAWRLTLTGCRARISFSRLLQLRLASEALGQVGIFGLLFGEGLRVSALDPSIPIENRLSSVTLDRAMFIASGVALSLCGTVAALLLPAADDSLRLSAGISAVILLGLLSVSVLVMLNRWPIASRSANLIGRVPFLRHRLNTVLPTIRSAETKLLDFHRDAPSAFWISLALNVVSQALSILEICLILWLMGINAGFLRALVFEALTKLVNTVGAFNPGNLGTYEGGNMAIARLLGMTSAAGFSVALCRRIRALFWAAVGALCLFLLPGSRAKRESASGRSSLQTEEGTLADSSPKNRVGITSVVFAHQFRSVSDPGSPLLPVGTVPILLRVILSIRKALGGQIIVCVNQSTGRDVRSALLHTRRLPNSVEWLEVGPDVPLPELIGQIAARSWNDRLMLIAGNSTYYPALFRQVQEWRGDTDALALTDSDQPIKIWALNIDLALRAASICNSSGPLFDQFHAGIIATQSVECRAIDSRLWQSVQTPEDRLAAERKLDRWLIKPTDGIFARMNRRVSVPISRVLARFPITPNMVSIITLAVGIIAGAFYAYGGYWSTLLGAVLSVWASILDGCDGEIARLKLLESDFGCWLETSCDYVYYLLIFAGLTIGLVRSSGSHMYLDWGAVLLAGAMMSILATGLGRHRLAARRPEQYLGIWQKKAESRKSNPILYIGRHTEFIVRRCFWPYALLVFALLDLNQIVLFLATIGANLVWLISLYSYLAFSVTPKSPSADFSVAAGTAPEADGVTTA